MFKKYTKREEEDRVQRPSTDFGETARVYESAGGVVLRSKIDCQLPPVQIVAVSSLNR